MNIQAAGMEAYEGKVIEAAPIIKGGQASKSLVLSVIYAY